MKSYLTSLLVRSAVEYAAVLLTEAVARRRLSTPTQGLTMKIYRTTVLNTHGARTFGEWHSSADGASKYRTAMKKADRTCDPQTTEHDVKTDRTSLLSFLNGLKND